MKPVLAVLGALACATAAAQRPTVSIATSDPLGCIPEGTRTPPDAVCLLRRYLQINTTNPPGREGQAARFWDALFKAYGIESQIVPLPFGEDRANVVARLRGNGAKRPLLLENHMDVVPAAAFNWTVPPFEGLLQEGRIYGRGAFDMKASGVVQAMALIAAKTEGWPLERDLIFLGTANEEGPFDADKGIVSGVLWLIENRLELLGNAEYAINEGAYIVGDAKRRTRWEISPSEKARMEARFENPLPAGASRAERSAAWLQLVRAAERALAKHPREPRLTDGTRRYFKQLAAGRADGTLRTALLDPDAALRTPRLRKALEADAITSIHLFETLVLTMLGPTGKGNITPAVATAALRFPAGKGQARALAAARAACKADRACAVHEDPRGPDGSLALRLRLAGEAKHASICDADGGAAARLVRLLVKLPWATDGGSARGASASKSAMNAVIEIDGVSTGREGAPAEGEISATFDSRLLPDDDGPKAVRRLTASAGKGAERVVISDPPLSSGESSIDTPLFAAIRRARDKVEAGVAPQPPIVTPPLPSTTDSVYFRQKGIVTYGFDPIPMRTEDERSHADDEFVPAASVEFGVRVMREILREFAAVKAKGAP